MPPPERTPHRPGSAARDEDATVPPPASASDTTAHAPQSARERLPAQLPAPFGRYRLLKLLGEGGMGRVYLAHDSQLDRPVALKVPLFGPEDGPALLERFYREARAAATILHANVCPVYDVGEIDGVPYLTMAFIEGKPLGELAAQKPLTPRQAASLVRKLALALAEAHKRGVIHRDLKPSNVMVTRQGEPVVMDFGLARRAEGGDARLTRQGAFLGTPAYAPPEQVSGEADNMGPACDVYSLGVILYELLAGRLPFEGDALLMISRVLLEEPPPPSKFRPGLDPELEAVCLKAMAKKPADRHASMATFAGALLDYLRGQTTVAESLPPPAPTASQAAPGQRPPASRLARLARADGGLHTGRRAPAGARRPPPYLRLYDVATGKALGARFRGHESWVNHVAISPDGRLALSAGNDKTMRLWDMASGLPAGAPAPHEGPVKCVAFSPDGRYGLSGEADKSIRLLSLSGPNPQPLFVRVPRRAPHGRLLPRRWGG